MKVKVNRRLSAGLYHVSFDISDFTPEELQKMASFGVPQITLQFVAAGARHEGQIALNQISAKFNASFPDEASAKNYEGRVLEQIRSAVQRLRDSEDKFTSSEEVPL